MLDALPGLRGHGAKGVGPWKKVHCLEFTSCRWWVASCG